jgi:hypothetical protein
MQHYAFRDARLLCCPHGLGCWHGATGNATDDDQTRFPGKVISESAFYLG